MRRLTLFVAVLLLTVPALAEDKSDSPGAHHSGGLVRTIGGPDDFGYVFYDTAEVECSELFGYVDISASGTGAGLAGADDDHAGPFPIGFSFPFYGASYTNFYVGTNGVLYFEDAYLGLSNTCPLPGTNGYDVHTYIAVYHDDLRVQADGDIYYQTFASCPVGAGGTCTIVQYHNMEDFGSTSDFMDFQVVLYPDGTIVLQYQQPANDDATQTNGASATVGIQGSPTSPPLHALEYSCNVESLAPSLAIAFAPPGALTAGVPDVCAGVTQPSADIAVTKTTTAETVQPGSEVTYSLAVTNNGPSDATNVALTDALPTGVSYVSNTCGGAYDAGTGTFTWTIGTLAASATVTCNLVVAVDAGAGGTIANTATVASAEADPDAANDTSTVRFQVFELRPIPAAGTVALALLVMLIAGAGLLVLRQRL